jgi:glycerol kinase
MEKDTARVMNELRADGGASMNPYLLQFQADIIDKPVRRPKMAETTALGSAMLAGLATGVWRHQHDLEIFHRGAKVFLPKMSGDTREALLAGWRDAITRVRQPTTRVAP